jgi:hypothetical protein
VRLVRERVRVLWAVIGFVDQDRINIRGKVPMSLFVSSSLLRRVRLQ